MRLPLLQSVAEKCLMIWGLDHREVAWECLNPLVGSERWKHKLIVYTEQHLLYQRVTDRTGGRGTGTLPTLHLLFPNSKSETKHLGESDDAVLSLITWLARKELRNKRGTGMPRSDT